MTGVVGRAELLSALFLLWSLLSYARGRWLLAVLLTLLAHGCKETGLLGFPLFIWMELACPSLVRQPPLAPRVAQPRTLHAAIPIALRTAPPPAL